MEEKLIEKIQKTGLSDKESRIYSYLIESNGAYPSDISRKTGINRSTTYKILDQLSIKGLVAEIEKGKKLYYEVEPPERLEKAARYQVENAERSLEYAKKIMPELEGMFNKSEDRPRVTFYEGKQRVVEAYLKHVEVSKPYKMAAFANVQKLRDWLPPDKFKYYIREKGRIGITARGITSTDPYSYQFLKDTHSPVVGKKFFPELKRVPYDMFPFPAEITMFDGNKISFIKFDEKNPIGVIIEDKTIHDMMYAIFEIAWIGADYINKGGK